MQNIEVIIIIINNSFCEVRCLPVSIPARRGTGSVTRATTTSAVSMTEVSDGECGDGECVCMTAVSDGECVRMTAVRDGKCGDGECLYNKKNFSQKMIYFSHL